MSHGCLFFLGNRIHGRIRPDAEQNSDTLKCQERTMSVPAGKKLKLPLPSDDRRWRLVGATMRRHGYRPSALIETLHTVQESFGYVDNDALRFVANGLHVPLSRAYGVATFYHFFSFKPPGKHTCVICLGTACYIKGGPDNLKVLEETFQVQAGETTADGQLSLLTARCLGACGLAPAAVFDGEMVGRLDQTEIRQRVERLLNDDA